MAHFFGASFCPAGDVDSGHHWCCGAVFPATGFAKADAGAEPATRRRNIIADCGSRPIAKKLANQDEPDATAKDVVGLGILLPKAM